MFKSKEDRKMAIIVAVLLFVAWMCRFPPFHVATIPYVGAACGLLRPLIYIGICTAWSVSLSRTIINKRSRIYLKAMAACCILWIFFRTVKYELTFRGDSINTLLQYAYYIPFILLPTLGFFVSLYAKRGDGYNMPRLVHIIVSFISFSAIIFVFTNPFHELFWKHTPEPYSHAVGFHIVIGWVVFLLTLTIINIVIKAKIPGKRMAFMGPFIILGYIIAFFATQFFFPKAWEFISNDWTSFTCIAAIGLMQSCITSGMIPSNRGYAKIFEMTADAALITDDDWNICYASATAKNLPKNLLQKTADGPFEMDKNTILKSSKLHPGYVVWKEDISAISAVLLKLEKNREELAAKNELDKENNKMELVLLKAQEKNRLFDLSQAATSKQNKMLKETLSQYFEETDADVKKKLLAMASVLGTYIKRKGNLIFVGDGGTIKATELKLCFKESLSNLELLQTACHMDYAIGENVEMPLEMALCLYDSFEMAIEEVMPDVEAAFIRVFEDNDNIRAIYSLVSSKDLSNVIFPKEVNVEKDEDTWIISLSISKGGKR